MEGCVYGWMGRCEGKLYDRPCSINTHSMQREEKADLGVSPAPEADDQLGGLCGENENAIAQAKKGAVGAGAAGKSKGARGAGEENNGAELEDMPQEGTSLEERSDLMAKLGDQPHRGEAKRRKLN